MATKPAIPFTYDDYKTLPESMDRRYELMDGELLMVPAPTVTHQSVLLNILALFAAHVRATRCGRVLPAPVDVVLGEGKHRDVVQPDVVFIGRDRAAIVTDAEIAGAPDLVVEVISPGTEERDRGYKKTAYERSGVREYWIVDAKRASIEVFRLGRSGYGPPARYGEADTLTTDVIPDLRVRVAELFDVTPGA